MGLKGEVGETPGARDTNRSNGYPWGTSWPPPNKVGNFADSSYKKLSSKNVAISNYDDGFSATSPVGSFPPLANGLYDLSGNVWEWCEDLYCLENKERVSRGGAWRDDYKQSLLSSFRRADDPEKPSLIIGFRVVLSGGWCGFWRLTIFLSLLALFLFSILIAMWVILHFRPSPHRSFRQVI